VSRGVAFARSANPNTPTWPPGVPGGAGRGVPGDNAANAAAYAAEYAACASGSRASGTAEKTPGVAGSPAAGVPGIFPGTVPGTVPATVPGVPSGNERDALVDALGAGDSPGFSRSGSGLASARLGPASFAGFRFLASEVEGVDALECDVTRWNTAGALRSAEPSVSSKPCASSRKSAPE
jgi:hypothetical protein